MTESDISVNHITTEPEDRVLKDDASDDTVMHDAVMHDAVPHTQSMSNGTTGNQLTSSPTSTPNLVLRLPPELRLIVYRDSVRLPGPIPYYLPLLWRDPSVRGLTGFLHTSRMIREESIHVFYRENTFFVDPLFTFPSQRVAPSRQLGDLIQNFAMNVQLWAALEASRQDFIHVMHAFRDPGIRRGTFSIHFYLHLRDHDFGRPPLRVFLRGLGRLTNFQIIEIYLHGNRGTFVTYPPVEDCIEGYYRCLEHRLQFVLGPASPRTLGQGLIFHPQQFSNAQPPRENLEWVDHLGGILHGNGDGSSDQNVDQNGDEYQNAVEFEPPAQS